MRSFIRLLLGVGALTILLYGAVRMEAYLRQSRESVGLNRGLAEQAVATRPAAPVPTEAGEGPTDSSAPPEETVPRETAPIEVDFSLLTQTNGEVIGWLYCPDTPINLPLVQGKDNDYYLNRLVDGSWNAAGTLFADCRNSPDFSDANTVIYGHNMKNREMFGSLYRYGEQEYYEAHPVMWLLTPAGDYKLELVAGLVTPSTSEVYAMDTTGEETLEMVRGAVGRSTFASPVTPEAGDRFVTLSTCSYEYDEARYVVIARLTALG